MKITGTSHVGYIVKDLGVVIPFYRDALGLKLLSGPSEEFHDVNEGKAMGIVGENKTHCHREAFFETPDGTLLEFIEITDPVPVPIPPTAACAGKLHLCLFVDNMDEWVNHLEDYGVYPFMKPQYALMGDGTQCIWVYFRDPEGILFELQEIRNVG